MMDNLLKKDDRDVGPKVAAAEFIQKAVSKISGRMAMLMLAKMTGITAETPGVEDTLTSQITVMLEPELFEAANETVKFINRQKETKQHIDLGSFCRMAIAESIFHKIGDCRKILGEDQFSEVIKENL